jgi:dihydrodipicolinate synthase/N-acetylneuraminate lyase
MLKGIFVPTFTAFTANGDLDLKATIDHANWLLKTDIAGLIPFGTFGEGASLSLEEMKLITSELLKIKGEKHVIPTLINNSLGTIKEFLTWLEGTDVTHAMVLPPSYFQPADTETMVAMYKNIVAATKIEIIAYNIPACAVELPVAVVEQVDVWGVKDSSGDLAATKKYLATGKNLLVGSDKLLIPALEAGANGGILGLANVFPEKFCAAYAFYIAGDSTRAQQEIDDVAKIIEQAVPANSSFAEIIGYVKSLSKQLIPTDLGYMRLPVKSQQAPKIKN